MAMNLDGKTLAIIAGIVLIFMFMQGQTQAAGDITTDTVIESLKNTALELINNIVGNPPLLIGLTLGIVALVILGKK